MSKFDMGDYVDVSERERLLFGRYPEARVQVELEDVRDGAGELIAWKAKATVWRSPDDTLPVCDWAVEPVPGKTPFTKDSEAMNASTSAVGRAIVLAGFETKKIASADEVRNRSAGTAPSALAHEVDGIGSPEAVVPASTFKSPVAQAQAAQPPEPADNPANEEVTFGKHKGLRVGDVPAGYLRWLADTDPKTPDGHRVKNAAKAVLGLVPAGVAADSDSYLGYDGDEIPF